MLLTYPKRVDDWGLGLTTVPERDSSKENHVTETEVPQNTERPEIELATTGIDLIYIVSVVRNQSPQWLGIGL